ncbi:MAG: hypothetical protein RLZZ380_651 [Actinomycetota bacterium]|jgi:DUF2075 family protein
MTDFRIEKIPFDREIIGLWASEQNKHSNWPVVYTLNGSNEIYVGETSNAAMRFSNHLNSESKNHLSDARVIFRDDFNKSACLDLESHLIKLFAADEKYKVLNGNAGITDSDYFQREKYRETFNEIFNALVNDGVLTRTVPDIVNSDLFKYSPFKALNTDQAIAIEGILEALVDQVGVGVSTKTVVEGEPGTGKTIVAIYLMKLIRDIALFDENEAFDSDNLFSDFFQSGFRDIFANLKIGLVIPQISLRKTVSKVFSRTPGLDPKMVLDPFEVGESDEIYDLLIVDESHRLQQRANQPAAERNIKYAEINQKLFGSDDKSKTQLDWITTRSRHQIFLLDSAQSVKPADLQAKHISPVLEESRSNRTHFKLSSQMRVSGGADYIDFIGQMLNGIYDEAPKDFGDYDLRFFDSFADMKKAIERQEREFGLSRLLAGFAWPWQSKGGKADFDIEIEGIHLPWNRRNYDWVSSPSSTEEVGSIHTIQGYDLNFAGVIIGRDLFFDENENKIKFSRENYFDKKGKENNPTLGIKYSDEDLLTYVLSIYRVLLTRGIKGTYVYVCDDHLRNHLRQFFRVKNQ